MDAFQSETIDRLARIETKIEGLTQLTNVISTIEKRSCDNSKDIKHHKETLDDHECRIDALEQKPIGRVNFVVNTAIAAVVSAVIAYLFKQ